MSGEAGKNPLRRKYSVKEFDKGADVYYKRLKLKRDRKLKREKRDEEAILH